MHLRANSAKNSGVLFENSGSLPLNGCWPVDMTDIKTPMLYMSDAVLYGSLLKTSGSIYLYLMIMMLLLLMMFGQLEVMTQNLQCRE